MKILGVTACISGIAHTYISAEAIQQAAKAAGHQVKVETRGSVGAENVLTEQDIREADVIIIAADLGVPRERFNGKPVFEVGTHEVVKEADVVIQKAIKFAKAYVPAKNSVQEAKAVKDETVQSKPEKSNKKLQDTGVYKHLMSGISFMIPFIVAGGIIIALSFAVSKTAFSEKGTLAATLYAIGGANAFALMIPILAGYIAFSIADRPGLCAGMVGGMIASSTGSGFIGGIIAGFLAGYTVIFIKKMLPLRGGLRAMMPILILPVFSTLFVGLIMVYVVGKPVAFINNGLTGWLNSLAGVNAVLLGFIIAAMIAVDLGGVFCRVSYAFAVATLVSGHPSIVMAAAMAGGLVPSLGMALTTVLSPHKFTNDEREAGKGCWVLGASFIVEGCIPFAARDPKVVIPAVTLGAGVAGALTAFFGCTQSVPHGGLWVMPIPGAIGNIPFYLLSVLIGIGVEVTIMTVFKKNVTAKGKNNDKVVVS